MQKGADRKAIFFQPRMNAKTRIGFWGPADELVLNYFVFPQANLPDARYVLRLSLYRKVMVKTFVNFCSPHRAHSNANACSFAIHLTPLMEELPDTPPAVPSDQSKSTRGALARLLIFLALAGIFFLAIDAVFTPGAFFMGGHFHLNHKWTGWGRMHSNIAGDYVIYMSISPYLAAAAR